MTPGDLLGDLTQAIQVWGFLSTKKGVQRTDCLIKNVRFLVKFTAFRRWAVIGFSPGRGFKTKTAELSV
jgi:hypothetical protein